MQGSKNTFISETFASEAMRLEAQYFNTRFDQHFQAWVCPCNEWIESEEGGIGDGGTCRHTQYLQSQSIKEAVRA